MRRRVLVTGGGGLIGRQVIDLLCADSEPIALARTGAGLPQDVEVIATDLGDPRFVSSLPPKVDAVIHLAQSSGYSTFPDHAQSVFQVNVAALAALLDWAVKAGVKHFVHASTGGLYGRGPHPFKEDACIRLEGSLAFYFGSKWAAEILAAPYSGIFSVTALRFFFVYGPGQKSTMLIPRLVKSVEEGRPVALGARDGMRLNPVYVEDAAAAAVAALGLEGDTIVNVGGAEVLSIRNIVETIGALIGREPHFHQAEVTEGEDLIADISRMRSLLHSPKTSFREGVGQLIRVACE